MQCIRELHDHGIALREIAVLFRAGFHSFDLESELTRSNIAFVKYGGFKFLESLHIKDVLAHLRIVANPTDRLSWIRILKLLPGIGDKTALQLAGKIAEDGIPRAASELTSKVPKYSTELDALLELINEIKSDAGPISHKVELINAYYFPLLKAKYDNYPKRMRDLEYLADLTTGYKSLSRFSQRHGSGAAR